MADYSEFPTTPTAWQEHAFGDITPLETEDPPPPAPRRSFDPIALVAGLAFAILAITVMVGVDFPEVLFRSGGLLWLVLICAGAFMLVGELRRARQRH